MSEEARVYLKGKVSDELLVQMSDEMAADVANRLRSAEVDAATEATMTEQTAEDGRAPNVLVNQDDVDEAQESSVFDATKDEVPDWVTIPTDLQIPRGSRVGFMLFKGKWTETAFKGDRHVIVWPLTDLDERMAWARIKDNFGHASNELSKQMIRSFDGIKVNWGAARGKPGNVEDFLAELGPRCRGLLARYYTRTHQLDSAEVAYFLEHCVAVRTMG